MSQTVIIIIIIIIIYPLTTRVVEAPQMMKRRIQAMEIKCYRKILCISYQNHVTNKEVCAKIQQAIGPHEDLTIVKRRTLQ